MANRWSILPPRWWPLKWWPLAGQVDANAVDLSLNGTGFVAYIMGHDNPTMTIDSGYAVMICNADSAILTASGNSSIGMVL